MGLLSILKKLKQKEKEVRLLMLGVAQPFIIGFSNQQCFGSGSVCCFSCGKDLDPDPACPLDADPDPDPAFHSDADLDPDPAFYFDAGKSRLGIDCQLL
jgi:hypothetical protein